MVENTRIKGISELAYLKDVDLEVNVSGSLLDSVESSSMQPFFTDMASHSEFSEYAPVPQTTIGDDIVYSYVIRRPRFAEKLNLLKDEFGDSIELQVQDDEIKPYHPSRFENNPVVVYNEPYPAVIEVSDIPTLDDIIENPNRSDFVVFDDELNSYNSHGKNLAVEDKFYQYNFRWHENDKGQIVLEIRRLNDSSTYIGEIYYHSIFDSEMKECFHADSHFLNYDKEGLDARLNGGHIVPLKIINFNGKPRKSKFYHFFGDFNEKHLDATEALKLSAAFFDDPRVDHYLKKMTETN